jgi:hypothetical protein
MTMRQAAIAIGTVALVLTGLGCSSTSEPGASLTPAITQPSDSGELRGLLLTDDQLRAAGLPADLTTRPDDQLSAYENPDPRGPCGTPMNQRDLYAGGVRFYAGSTVAVFEAVSRLPQARAEELLGAIAADIRPGCPEFISRTNTGADQTNHFGAPIELGGIGDQAIGWQTTQGVQGQLAHVYCGIVRDGDLVVTLVVIAPTLLEISVVRRAVEAAGNRLRSASATTTTS